MRAAEFAAAVGYGEDLVYKIEGGKRIPRPEYLDRADEVLLTWFKSSYSSSSEGDSCVEVAFDWRKSSYSSGNDGESCVEVAVDWRKSSYSSGSEGDSCLEVATTPRTIHIRDSKHTGGPRLILAPEAWTDFLAYASRD